jgi:hypothetical protein
VKSVNTMDETILVPCRLMDLKVGDENDPTCPKKHNQKSKHGVQELLSSVDLFQIYNMLNNVKADLLWGQGQVTEEAHRLLLRLRATSEDRQLSASLQPTPQPPRSAIRNLMPGTRTIRELRNRKKRVSEIEQNKSRRTSKDT